MDSKRNFARINFILYSCIAVGLISISFNSIAFQKEDFIWSEEGKKCWYTQIDRKDDNHFYIKLTGHTRTIIFNDRNCMKDSMSLEHMLNKMMINIIVQSWYLENFTREDANFQVRADELYDPISPQIRGKCMQSKKYKDIGIAIDYLIENNSIAAVTHGIAPGGCGKS